VTRPPSLQANPLLESRENRLDAGEELVADILLVLRSQPVRLLLLRRVGIISTRERGLLVRVRVGVGAGRVVAVRRVRVGVSMLGRVDSMGRVDRMRRRCRGPSSDRSPCICRRSRRFTPRCPLSLLTCRTVGCVCHLVARAPSLPREVLTAASIEGRGASILIHKADCCLLCDKLIRLGVRASPLRKVLQS